MWLGYGLIKLVTPNTRNISLEKGDPSIDVKTLDIYNIMDNDLKNEDLFDKFGISIVITQPRESLNLKNTIKK